MLFSEYNEFLTDDRWKAKRLEILIRDNFTCQHCGAKKENWVLGAAFSIFVPLLLENEKMSCYIQQTGEQSLRRVAPEYLTAEETALLAQRDLMLDEEEVMALIKELRAAQAEKTIIR